MTVAKSAILTCLSKQIGTICCIRDHTWSYLVQVGVANGCRGAFGFDTFCDQQSYPILRYRYISSDTKMDGKLKTSRERTHSFHPSECGFKNRQIRNSFLPSHSQLRLSPNNHESNYIYCILQNRNYSVNIETMSS